MSISPTTPDSEPDWSADEIERAYQRALEAFDDGAVETLAEPPAEPVAADTELTAAAAAVDTNGAAASVADPTLPISDRDGSGSTPTPVLHSTPPVSRSPSRLVSGAGLARESSNSAEDERRVSPVQVIEAALFVGGAPLSAGKLYALLRGTITVEQVPLLIDELNTLYAAQARPYEIRLGDGGYRLELRQEFDRLKQRVFGQGPREVRLAQDVLEVLAVVAYRQPLSEADFEKYGKTGVGNVLRQLLRRDLIQIERGENGPKDVRYRTTDRFLSVFGIGNLSELPHPEDLAVR